MVDKPKQDGSSWAKVGDNRSHETRIPDRFVRSTDNVGILPDGVMRSRDGYELWRHTQTRMRLPDAITWSVAPTNP